MKYLIFCAIFLFSSFSFERGNTAKSAYQIFDKNGKKVTYKKILKKVQDVDLILFGELHNNPIAHWLELELTRDIFEAKNGAITLGAEMFETDNQLLLNEYLSGQISEKNFEKEAKLWPNYDTDYKPLLSFAKANNTGFVATNIPRRYASMVYHKGISSLVSLSDAAKALIAPLPIATNIELPAYKSLLAMAGDSEQAINFPHAQMVKDATMAYFIHNAMSDDHSFIHYNGAYHSDHYEGIVWYMQQLDPTTKMMTISTVNQSDISKLAPENQQKADFIICIPENMTKTY